MSPPTQRARNLREPTDRGGLEPPWYRTRGTRAARVLAETCHRSQIAVRSADVPCVGTAVDKLYSPDGTSTGVTDKSRFPSVWHLFAQSHVARPSGTIRHGPSARPPLRVPLRRAPALCSHLYASPAHAPFRCASLQSRYLRVPRPVDSALLAVQSKKRHPIYQAFCEKGNFGECILHGSGCSCLGSQRSSAQTWPVWVPAAARFAHAP